MYEKNKKGGRKNSSNEGLLVLIMFQLTLYYAQKLGLLNSKDIYISYFQCVFHIQTIINTIVLFCIVALRKEYLKVQFHRNLKNLVMHWYCPITYIDPNKTYQLKEAYYLSTGTRSRDTLSSGFHCIVLNVSSSSQKVL